MPLDVAYAHAPRIHRQNLIVESRPPRLVLLHHPRLELAVAVPRRFDFHLAEIAFQRLQRHSVAAVAAVVSFRIVLLVAQVLGHLPLHGPLHHPLRELLQKPVYVFRLPSLLQPCVDQFVAYRCNLLCLLHFVLLVSPENVYTDFLTPSRIAAPTPKK